MRRNAVLFVGISLLSGFGGSAMSLVTSVWLLDLTGSSSLAAIAVLCVYAPTLAGPWLGGLVDRVPRRSLVIGVNLGLAGTLLALFAVRGPVQAWIVYTVSLAYGLSSIGGGLLAGRLIARYGAVAVGVAGTVLFGVACLARCLPWWPVTVATAVVAGVGLPWTLVSAVTAVQTHAPPALLGRVAATANTVMFAPIAAAVPIGSAAVHLGARPSLVAAGLACLLAATAVPRTARTA